VSRVSALESRIRHSGFRGVAPRHGIDGRRGQTRRRRCPNRRRQHISTEGTSSVGATAPTTQHPRRIRIGPRTPIYRPTDRRPRRALLRASDHHRREAGFGRVYASTHLPPNGMPPFNSHTFTHLLGSPHSHNREPPAGFAQSSQFGPLSKVPFPPFDGENPRLWITRSEDYFDIYNVDPSAWIRVSTMHFTGPASRWLQSLGPRFRFFPWANSPNYSLNALVGINMTPSLNNFSTSNSPPP
jgi:hypothetical protein